MKGSSGNELAGAPVTPTGVPILNLPVSSSSRQRLESVAPAGANHARMGRKLALLVVLAATLGFDTQPRWGIADSCTCWRRAV